MLMLPPAVGYYTDASQDRENPFYDPGINVPCPFCMQPLTEDNVRTMGLMAETRDPELSAFYRCHRTCHESATAESQQALDEAVMAMLDVLAKQTVVVPPALED